MRGSFTISIDRERKKFKKDARRLYGAGNPTAQAVAGGGGEGGRRG